MLNLIHSTYRTLVPKSTRDRIYRFRNRAQLRKLRKAVYPSPKGDFSLRPFDQHRCIFVHIPKTAGTSVALSLFGYLPYHYSTRYYRIIYGHRQFNAYFKFCFVRNPWDRVASAYFYLKSGGWNNRDRKWADANLGAFGDFNGFVRNWLTRDNIYSHIHFQPQHTFICGPDLELQVDYVGRMENLHSDYTAICSRLGINRPLAHHNRNARPDYRSLYTTQTRQIVEHVYKNDIEIFGYRFAR